MAKMNINEERLQELIQESIYEVLEEWKWLNNIADKAGRAFQNVKTGFRQAKRSFDAGRNYVRDKHKDFNEYERYGDKENDLRRMGLGGYEQYRYNLERNRNMNARGETQGATTQQATQNNNIVQPHPGLNQPQQPNKLQQSRLDRENQAKQALYKSGMVPQGTKGVITGWVRKDGQKPDENQLKLIDNWKRVKLYEGKRKRNKKGEV